PSFLIESSAKQFGIKSRTKFSTPSSLIFLMPATLLSLAVLSSAADFVSQRINPPNKFSLRSTALKEIYPPIERPHKHGLQRFNSSIILNKASVNISIVN